MSTPAPEPPPAAIGGGMDIKIAHPFVKGGSVTVAVLPTDTLAEVKARCHFRPAVPTVLIFKGLRMEDDSRTLYSYGVTGGATLRAPKAHSNAGKGVSNRGTQAVLRCFDIPLAYDSQLQLLPLSKARSRASSTHKRSPPKRAPRARKRQLSWRRVVLRLRGESGKTVTWCLARNARPARPKRRSPQNPHKTPVLAVPRWRQEQQGRRRRQQQQQQHQQQ